MCEEMEVTNRFSARSGITLISRRNDSDHAGSKRQANSGAPFPLLRKVARLMQGAGFFEGGPGKRQAPIPGSIRR